MEKEKTFTFKEFQRKFFPNKLLNRLEERICSELSLIESYQHRLSKSEDNPKTGTLEFYREPFPYLGIKSPFCFGTSSDILDIVSRFYEEEGYEVEQKNNRIEAKKGKENYWIMAFDHEDSYKLLINKGRPSSLYFFGRQMAHESLEKEKRELKKVGEFVFG